MNLQEFMSWAQDTEPIYFKSIVTPDGVSLIVEKPWPKKMTLGGQFLELTDLQFLERTEEGVKITAKNGWAIYKQVAGAKEMFDVPTDVYGYEYVEGEWSEPEG